MAARTIFEIVSDGGDAIQARQMGSQRGSSEIHWSHASIEVSGHLVKKERLEPGQRISLTVERALLTTPFTHKLIGWDI